MLTPQLPKNACCSPLRLGVKEKTCLRARRRAWCAAPPTARRLMMMSGISGTGGMPNAQMMERLQSKLFSKADTDGSGKLSEQEFTDMLKSSPMGSNMSAGDISHEFGKLDTEKTGQLTQAQVEQGGKDLMANFKSTLQSFGSASFEGGESTSTSNTASDDLMKSLLQSLQSESGSSQKSSRIDEQTSSSMQQVLQRLVGQLNSTYGDSSSSASGLSLQA
jgi:hypothetical protein